MYTRMQEVNADDLQPTKQRGHHDDSNDVRDTKVNNHTHTSEKRDISPNEYVGKAQKSIVPKKIMASGKSFSYDAKILN